MKRITIPSLLLMLALLLSSCSTHLGLSNLLGGGNSKKHAKATPGSTIAQTTALTVAKGVAISITGTAPQPNVLKPKVGEAVIWTNNDTVPESVTSDTPGLFDSGPINPGGKFTFTFTQAGTYKYHSTTNPNMHGAVVVLP